MKIIAKNKFARFNYEIIDQYVAGLELKGWEVKSIRAHHVNLKNAFCSFKKDELFVTNMHVAPWMLEKNDEFRPRKLLLHRSELKRISLKIQSLRLVIIPLAIGWENGKIKLAIALAKARKKVDKRQAIKTAEIDKKLKKVYNVMGV